MTMMTPDGAAAKAMAEAVFRRQDVNDVPEGQQAQEAAKLAEAEKTARLRALRLAKEETDRIAAEVRRARLEGRLT